MIILDTNALIYSVKQKIDIRKFLDEDIVVPTSVIKELDSLSHCYEHARVARILASHFKTLEVENGGDAGIIEAAKRYGGRVLTNDRKLILILKRENVETISVSKAMVRHA
ncbi:MAG: PIN domain-containing protein [Thermoplasmatales archaeon]